MGDAVRLLAVDDQDYFRGVLREVIDRTDGFELVGDVPSGEAALQAVEELSPQLVIIDKRMPGMGGLALCRALTQSHPEIVLVITSVEEPPTTPFSGCNATFIRKQHLSPRFLRELWGEQSAQA